jgi:NAD(P)-dependent dehydrogenase (short-subunit alcohol dehydrogenase family)
VKKLEGKVAVITGGNSGIGLATAQRFAAEGAHVFITGRRQGELDAAVRDIGKNVTAVQGDVSKLADLDRLYATVKQHQGRIDVLFANAGGGELAPLGSVYSAAKAAVRSFARSWTVDLKHRKIRVNAISPGPIETPGINNLGLSAEQIKEFKTTVVAAVPMGRMGSADEVAHAALFLASDDSSYVTGTELFVDGGMAQI